MLSFDDTDLDQYTVAFPEMQKYGFKGVFFIMTVSLGRPHYMSRDQVRTLSDEGNTIGSHTWDHHNVKKYAGNDWITQLDRPTKQLEQITGKSIRYFAYPFGLWNTAAFPELKKRGFVAAFQLNEKPDQTDPLYCIRRIIVPGTWNGTSYTGVTQLLAIGHNGTALQRWDGSGGIVTTMTDATGSNYTSIGVAKASDVRPATATATQMWAGQTITGTDTLVMYTYAGDANLDGRINIDDYVRIDNGIAGNLSGWSNGDFNYDGKINIDDYTSFIDLNITNQGVPFYWLGSGIDGGGNAGVSAVPEPTGAAMLLVAGATLLFGARRSPHSPRLPGSRR